MNNIIGISLIIIAFGIGFYFGNKFLTIQDRVNIQVEAQKRINNEKGVKQ